MLINPQIRSEPIKPILNKDLWRSVRTNLVRSIHFDSDGCNKIVVRYLYCRKQVSEYARNAVSYPLEKEELRIHQLSNMYAADAVEKVKSAST